ncbi:DUF2282 domain-containing protein [Burkholderia mayonis]|uniref:DUF2282 domain-containing protein n=1 Tax=Burkholderia mayonis TaxID=1385591 RepID=A0A1B4FTU5_9BURK|nr:DUF2282 domain-containing protein [Burkholderia mayonis]AOJ07104.1 hypothetical protein WS71_07095 [Burkholderia mayonis]KVE45986.1 hypothetical protein WS71_23220 [Burkholderia mayonis]
MSRSALTISSLSAAIGVALAMQAVPGQAQGMKDTSGMPQVVKDNMARMAQNKLEKCYGINAMAKNDCAEGAHSCAGQASQARDPKSFVLLPAGDCGKISGGMLKAG